MADKLTLWMGTETDSYKAKLEEIGENLKAQGIDVEDKRRGGISLSAVVRHLIDTEIKNSQQG